MVFQQLGTAVEEIQALKKKNIALSDGQEEMLSAWEEYRPLLSPSEAEIEQEIAERTGSPQSAFNWHLEKGVKVLLEDLPSAVLWDAFLMMVIGMALFKSGFLQGNYPIKHYMLIGSAAFLVGFVAFMGGVSKYQQRFRSVDIQCIYQSNLPCWSFRKWQLGGFHC